MQAASPVDDGQAQRGGWRVSGSLEEAIFRLLEAAGAGRSITPEQVARSIGGEAGRAARPQVRATAVGLARQGRLVILRHGKPVDPAGLKGVYRLGAAKPEAGG